LKRGVVEIEVSTQKVAGITDALVASERARIDLNGALVCPLDALARGSLGEEVAVLVETLRLSSTDMLNLHRSLSDIRKLFVECITVDFAGALAMCVQNFANIHS
jgi:hypothetical protein